MRDHKPQLKPTPTLSFASWIVWEDADLVAVNKPAGIASQGGEGLAGQNLVDLARTHFRLDNVAVLHRIDRNVSGVVLLAKTTRAARAMSELVASGQLDRRYDAVVKGRVMAPLTLCHWLRKDSRHNQVELLDAPDIATNSDATTNIEPTANAPAGYKYTVTRVAAVRELHALIGVCTIVNAWPITGRSHQIRAQLSAAGFPIVGDPKYGVEAKGLSRPLLHAASVRFTHPITQVETAIAAPTPWTASALSQLRRRDHRHRP